MQSSRWLASERPAGGRARPLGAAPSRTPLHHHRSQRLRVRASKAAGDAATGRQRAPAAADQDDTPSCSGSGLAQQQQQRSAVKRSEHLRGAALLVVAAAAAATSLAQPTPAGATAVAAPPAPAPAPSPSTPYATSSSSSSSSSRGGSDGQPDMTITHLVYLDIAIATRAFKPAEQRTLGDKSVLPDSAAPAGRIVLGLYGRAAPATVSNFLAVVTSGALAGTTFSRVLPGEYVMAGKQGARRMGELEPPADLQSNPDASDPSAFRLSHSRPGTLSLALTENDEDPVIKERPNYRNVEFLITTGPGPVPRLDGQNIVFGRVVEGLGAVSRITAVQTFRPSDGNGSMNAFAKLIGDDRAANVKRKYGRPLQAVIITDAGLLPANSAAA